MARGGSMIAGMNRLQLFVGGDRIKPFIPNHVVQRISNPIPSMTPTGYRANGFEATLLADICEAVLKAREAKALQTQQLGIAAKCEILLRGFARVGIIALVDEATGYQRDRARDALAGNLEAFIAKELQPWVRTFPTDFYQEMFRLRGMKFPAETPQKPRYFTNDIVYDRLAPGVFRGIEESQSKGRGDRTSQARALPLADQRIPQTARASLTIKQRSRVLQEWPPPAN
jgi:P63C domain